MWRKRSGFGYFRVFYQLFPILSPSLNLQGMLQVSVLYECGVCPSIVFFKTVSDMVLLPNRDFIFLKSCEGVICPRVKL